MIAESSIVLHGGVGPVAAPEYALGVLAHLLVFAAIAGGVHWWVGARAE